MSRTQCRGANMQKTKNLRYNLKRWSKGVSKLKVLIQNSNETLAIMDTLEDKRPLYVQESNFREILKTHLQALLKYQNEYWRKRCTIRYFRFADENTKLFQSLATERYRHNAIAMLRVGEVEIHDHVGKEGVLFNTYKDRLGSSKPTSMKFDLSRIIRRIDGLDQLSAPFSTDEIDVVIKEMPNDRAPGPDGFNGCFLKKCWQIIKSDFYDLCHAFHAGGLDITSISEGYITLIPKISSPETANDFRPITLLNCCLKVITKILANRLQKVILKIIHRNQYGFIKGRTIQDCLAWSYEYIHQCHSSGREIVLLKLDFAKAFDTIEHAPMLDIMKHMGFDDRWLGWMETIFGSGVSSVLLNGVPGRKFKCKCGVRQGDPLSPMIFVLAADLLQAAINDAYTQGLLELPIPRENAGDFPVVQYADDTILVMQACPTQAARMKLILEDYAASVGLKINFHKSTLIPINADHQHASGLAGVFGCSVGTLPFTYLGLPMGTTRPSVLDLMPLVHSVERKTSTALSLMSSGAKLTLVNSVITSMLIYAMCTIKLHPKVVEHLDKLRRYCLWAKNSDDGIKANSLAAWELVCRPKRCGGLGVIDIKIQNAALLLKYLFKFYNREDVPWVQLVWEAYYPNKVPHATELMGSFWWKDVMQLSGTFRGVARVIPGDGCSSLFWKDVWFSDTGSALMDTHPRAFSYALNEDDSVARVLRTTDPAMIFSLPLSAQAREEIREIQQGSSHVCLEYGSPDVWVCDLGRYSSKKYYNHCFKQVKADEAFGWLWKSKCPIKFKMFGWLLMVDRLNTRNMLKRRHFAVAGGNYTCMLCQNPPEETVEHLFFECPFAKQCWSKVGLTWPGGTNRLAILHGGRESWRRPLFMDIFLLAAWSLWMERNNQHFRGIPRSFVAWLARFKLLLGLVIHNCPEKVHPFLSDFIVNLDS